MRLYASFFARIKVSRIDRVRAQRIHVTVGISSRSASVRTAETMTALSATVSDKEASEKLTRWAKDLKMAAFNVQVFGRSKMRKPDVGRHLTKASNASRPGPR